MTTPNLESLGGIGLASAVTLALLGVPLQPIIWGLIGGFLGAGFAKPSGWLVSAATYLSASLLSSLAGHSISAQFFGGNGLVGSAFSAGIAVLFHPLLSAAVQRMPALLDWALSILPRRGQP